MAYNWYISMSIIQPRRTAAAAVANALRHDIAGMILAPGAPLQDRLLCERFGTSRTPVREALLRLSDEGLVDIFPQSGTFVARIPVAAVHEAAVIRQALEAVTVAAAAGRGASAPLDSILATQRHAATQGDQRAFHEADEAFHAALADAGGYPGVWAMLRGVKIHIDRARRLTLPAPGRMAQIVTEHRAIRDAVAAVDPDAAQAAMRAHLSVVIPDVARLQQQHPGYFV